MTIATVLRKLESTTKSLEKKQILRENDSPLLRKYLFFALNPYKVFYLRKIPLIVQDNSVTIPFDSDIVWYLLDSLADRTVTGHEAIRSYENVVKHMTDDDAEVLRRVLIKDLRCGVNTATVNSVFPGLIPEFNVMLCHGFDDSRVKYPCGVQPKIDGIRALAFIKGTTPDDVVFYSRSGKEIKSLNSIAEQLVKAFPPGQIVDGEAKAVGTFQNTASVVTRSKNMKTDKINFMVFDTYTIDDFNRGSVEAVYTDRMNSLTTFLNSAKDDEEFTDIVKYIPALVANNKDEVMARYADFISEGFEGAIVKTLNGKYEFDRSYNWMKIKPLETVDLEVIGYEKGDGKYANTLGAMIVMFGDKPCSVGTGFSDKMRDEIWNNKDKYIGTLAEISYMEKTDDGLMRHNRFERFRTFKGEKI